ncbi:MAG: glycosyltransferase family 2 protein [Proteobacteria bacterium]|nr:glycosyltransferase family 2 protein [Pseudomonadota bacterium]
MTPNPILGICIPTYKRPGQLLACVQSIVRSAGKRIIPVFISDDSTDDTNVATIEQLIASYPHIFHFRNPENLGIDRNILRSVDICSCRYAWLLGEDDRLLPGAVSSVLDVLKREDPRFLYVNYRSVDASMKIVLKDRSLPLMRADTMEASEFLARDAWSMGFIGSCVIRTEYWRAIKPDRYIGTYFAHVGRVMEYLKGQSLFRIADPLVLNRCGSPGTFSWTDSTFEVISGWKRLMKELEPLYGGEICQDSVQSFERAHGLNSLYFLAYLRADSVFNRNVFKCIIRSSEKSIGYKLGSWIIALTPPIFFQGMRFLLNQVRAVRYGRL